VIEHPAAVQYTCFHLEFQGRRLNDFSQVSEIEGLGADSELHVVEDPYTEKEARVHFIRIRELIGAAGDRTDTAHGILAGTSIFNEVATVANEEAGKDLQAYDFGVTPDLSVVLPQDATPACKTVKLMTVSPWNPPPAHWRQKGHLLYLVITTNEGEQFHVTAHVGGFFVSNSNKDRFNPTPRTDGKGASAHSLFTLLTKISPSFSVAYDEHQKYLADKGHLAVLQMGNTLPSSPWLVPPASSPLRAHVADQTRTQETFLMGGAENADSLRDWNEEFQSAKELPKTSIQDRVFRERLLAKLFADYNEAAARGAVLVARGEVAPLNPTEGRDAQIFVYNNIFYSFGADGVGTFTSEGGDEAARVATGKDVQGVKIVNQFDIDGLYTPGTVVVDYLGKRIVGQSIVPGIFRQPEPGENQIHYGAVDGKDVVAADEQFAEPFSKLGRALHLKKHPVWDKENKRFDLEASVEIKGLLGTDGRKYVLDLYRITPLDIAWLEDKELEGAEYPHRMTVLRPELIELLSKRKAHEFVRAELLKRAAKEKEDAAKEGEKKEGAEESAEKAPEKAPEEGAEKPAEEAAEEENEEEKPKVNGTQEKTEETAEGEGEGKKDEEKKEDSGEAKEEKPDNDRVDMSGFKFALNPDVFSGQVPQSDEEKEEMAKDEQEVREACSFLRDTVIPGLLKDLQDSDVSFPMDGRSLTSLLHRRGINVRYLGKLASLADSQRVACFREVCVREMISRAFKHIARQHLKTLPLPLASSCLSHLLNCLLGTGLNPKPVAEIDESLRNLFPEADLSFEKVTPESLREAVQHEVARRFRYTLPDGWWNENRHVQLLREISLKLGLQIQYKKFQFAPSSEAEPAEQTQPNPESASKKKNKKKGREASPTGASSSPVQPPHTFTPDDIVNIVPLVKDSTPRSALSEEALEAGRLSIYQGQRKLGEDLLVESLSLHEQIYGPVHPEVASMYLTLSQLYTQMDHKDAAVELAKKAAVVGERTVGIDSAETVLNYLNLSLFLHQSGQTKLALGFAKHALTVWKVIYGPDHPDSITSINNYAVMLQSLKEYHESRRWFEESLRVCEKSFGRQSVNAATLLFQLAQALALDQNAKGAVDRMRESYNIFRTILGPEDRNTKEAEHWLEQLTTNAVSIAKQAKDLEARRARAGYRFTSRGVGAAAGAGPSSTTAAAGSTELPSKLTPPPDLSSRTIDELVRYIEGTDKKKKKPADGAEGGKKRTGGGRSNPKKRGGARS
jgi:protein TIF31